LVWIVWWWGSIHSIPEVRGQIVPLGRGWSISTTVIATTTTSTTTTMFERCVEENHQSLFTFSRIYRAYLNCRKHKRNSKDALIFELNLEENLVQLVESLRDRSYQPATSVCFYVSKPKMREIFAADFKDRIVHHLNYELLAPVWEKIFIDQSFACRPEKGTHHAAKVLQKYLRKITCNGKRPAFYLKMDVKNFFISINKHLLYKMIIKKCHSEEIRWLLKVIIFHDPTEDYQLKSSKTLQQKVPQQKSLFHVLEDCGLPIGNLTSQFFANIFLNALDQFVKHVLNCRYYVRYVDDFILLSVDKNQLLEWKSQIIQFLADELLLQINEKATRLDSIYNGVDFVGFIVRPFYMLCRRRVIGNMKSALRKYQQKLVKQTDQVRIWNYDSISLERLLATMNSYLGHLSHAHTRNVIKKVCQDFSFLREYYILTYRKLIRKYDYPKAFKNIRQQIHYFSSRFRDQIVIFQIGCYYETYGQSAERLSQLLNYKLRKGWRGMNRACGFHQRFLNSVCCKLETDGISFVVIKQTGKYLKNIMERFPSFRVEIISATS